MVNHPQQYNICEADPVSAIRQKHLRDFIPSKIASKCYEEIGTTLETHIRYGVLYSLMHIAWVPQQKKKVAPPFNPADQHQRPVFLSHLTVKEDLEAFEKVRAGLFLSRDTFQQIHLST
ncbi:hypothetical protein EVAR_10440_1 [Eumeta japonica]|uniref:Uncharacterized protein n=1 Tax=Eumeta variegata TaxID=151549 RepID=A0A4C1TIE0_EUMVA|nr:hypothetical protein EVAR_10440_1 [Eumeta japonica]